MYSGLFNLDLDGVPVDAESLPTGVCYVDNAATADEVTITKPAGTTGLYGASVEPADPGDVVEVVVSVTVSGVTVPDVQVFRQPSAVAKLDAAISTRATPAQVDTAVAGLLDVTDGVEVGWSLRKVLRIFGAVLAGKTVGAGTSSEQFRSIDDSKVRVTSNIDAAGDRSEVVLDAD
ncbi:MAG TPA: hypothetical protein PK458_20255 [Phycisphaerae bacterium]|nr:hypothetical protein [Phycisphaerae bacterium]